MPWKDRICTTPAVPVAHPDTGGQHPPAPTAVYRHLICDVIPVWIGLTGTLGGGAGALMTFMQRDGVGCVCLVVCLMSAWLLACSVYAILSPSCALTLDEAGLTDNTTRHKRLIPWAAIREVRFPRDRAAWKAVSWVELVLEGHPDQGTPIRIELFALDHDPLTIIRRIHEWVEITRGTLVHMPPPESDHRIRARGEDIREARG